MSLLWKTSLFQQNIYYLVFACSCYIYDFILRARQISITPVFTHKATWVSGSKTFLNKQRSSAVWWTGCFSCEKVLCTVWQRDLLGPPAGTDSFAKRKSVASAGKIPDSPNRPFGSHLQPLNLPDSSPP
jgi:hypothetical protein